MTVRKIKSIGDVPYPIDDVSDAFSPLLTAGAALGITGNDAEESAWLARTSTADGVASVRSIHGNTIVQDGSLLPVNMTGIETTRFNQWDEVWELGTINANDGTNVPNSTTIRSKNYIPVFPGQTYYCKGSAYFWTYAADKTCVGRISHSGAGSTSLVTDNTIDIPSNVSYLRFVTPTDYGTTYKGDICINLSDPTRNGEYEPYWSAQREIAASTYFPDGMRSAGTVYDELTATEAIVRVGEVDLGTLTWAYVSDNAYFYAIITDKAIGFNNIRCAKYQIAAQAGVANLQDGQIVGGNNDSAVYIKDTAYSDAATFKAAMSGVMLHYALATPTVTPIDPALNLSYRVEDFGTERIMVPENERSAPPTIVTAQGYTAESLRDAALSAIAPIENGLASTNYGVGSYLVHDGQLCRVTTAIATGESITIGTNVTATTVMADVIALIAQ